VDQIGNIHLLAHHDSLEHKRVMTPGYGAVSCGAGKAVARVSYRRYRSIRIPSERVAKRFHGNIDQPLKVVPAPGDLVSHLTIVNSLQIGMSSGMGTHRVPPCQKMAKLMDVHHVEGHGVVRSGPAPDKL
jgi:hypothetical protein